MLASVEKFPALVLNADYRPLSYFPLSAVVMARCAQISFSGPRPHRFRV